MRTKHSTDRRTFKTTLSQCLGLFFTLIFSVQALAAPPMVIGPKDIQRLHQQTVFNSDFSETEFYDLDNPVELSVTIFRVHMPEVGHAELIFTVDENFNEALKVSDDPEALYSAILQIAPEAKRLKLDNGQLKKGLQARLTGWPATESSQSATLLLIDEVELVHNGKRLAMHADNPKMAEKKLKTNTPQE